MFRLARNTVIDFVRTSHEHADLAQSAERAGSEAGPDELAVTRQEIDAVGAALSTLTDDQRDAITLRFFAGLSAREAAEVMGKQEGTVRGLQFRAIAALRRQLGIDDPEAPATVASARASEDGLMDDDDRLDRVRPERPGQHRGGPAPRGVRRRPPARVPTPRPGRARPS